MRVIVASDKLKGSLTAAQVAHHVTLGLRRVVPDLVVGEVPVADGGDGTVVAALSAGFRFVPVCAEGPTGARVRTGYAVRYGVAVVELADVLGLRRLPGGEFAPMTAVAVAARPSGSPWWRWPVAACFPRRHSRRLASGAPTRSPNSSLTHAGASATPGHCWNESLSRSRATG